MKSTGSGPLSAGGALRKSPCPEKAELASFPGLPESFGMERTKKTAATEAVGRRMDAGQDGKTEILAERSSTKPQRTEARCGAAFTREVFDASAGHPNPHLTAKHPVGY